MTGTHFVLTSWLRPPSGDDAPAPRLRMLITRGDLGPYLTGWTERGPELVTVTDPTPTDELELPLVGCVACLEGAWHHHGPIERPALVCTGCVGRGTGTRCCICGGGIPLDLRRDPEAADEFRADCGDCTGGHRHTHTTGV